MVYTKLLTQPNYVDRIYFFLKENKDAGYLLKNWRNRWKFPSIGLICQTMK